MNKQDLLLLRKLIRDGADVNAAPEVIFIGYRNDTHIIHPVNSLDFNGFAGICSAT